jgi:hypothetical protein
MNRRSEHPKAWMSIGACTTVAKNGVASACKEDTGSCGFVVSIKLKTLKKQDNFRFICIASVPTHSSLFLTQGHNRLVKNREHLRPSLVESKQLDHGSKLLCLRKVLS